MDLIIIAATAALASLITLFSGFGLGTILMPVFVLFFPVEIAIALTGIVYLLNNLFKVVLLGRFTDWRVAVRFGIPSVAGAFLGAELLLSLSTLTPLAEYSLFGTTAVVYPVKVIIAVLMILFVVLEGLPALKGWSPSSQLLLLGGMLSGFFGGLSGHQGALRSAFLIRYGMAKEQFLATGIVIACFVDVTRLSLYTTRFLHPDILQHGTVVAVAVGAAFLGAYAGNRLMAKITVAFVQKAVAFLLLLIAAGLGMGVL